MTRSLVRPLPKEENRRKGRQAARACENALSRRLPPSPDQKRTLDSWNLSKMLFT
jgi:hypothetical protein